MIEAQFYNKLPNQKVQCKLCPKYCLIPVGEMGICRARKNIEGKLFSLNYQQTVTISIDPIEKKPLYHFYPGNKILSLGCNSCNLTCKFCQNYNISQLEVKTITITKEQVFDICLKNNLEMVAFTYTEPVTWYEFILECSEFLKENDIKTVLVTNGFINEKPLLKLLPYIDAMNIDLKSMDEDFYENICGGELKPVLKTIEIASKSTHLEITNLVITNQNDSLENIGKLVDFIANLNKNIPIHFSKYYPNYLMSESPTSERLLYEIYELATKKLNFVYLGNIYFDNNTKCPNCHKILIERRYILNNYIINGTCRNCGTKIYGKF
ncbi:MAG: AmmeMemoRadiSam system radical SAM enzyme [Candidatus Cloacimonetes bacterium]|nr:AmmeMemoRadiSam system radical SAM enzyme [Candidatus Cloacimonadota bacterium]